MIEVKKYNLTFEQDWDKFIETSKNGHFMFYRAYVEYHADRFKDNSLIFTDKNSKFLAVLPANIKENILYSHQGLTFGGLVMSDKTTTDMVRDIFDVLIDYCHAEKIKKIIYKPIPYIYALTPSQEDLYVLFTKQATLIRRDVSSAINLSVPIKYSKGRKWSVNRARKESIQVIELCDFSDFWHLLEQVLKSHHGAVPTHSISEIQLLHKRFPTHIRLFVAMHRNEIIAGTVVYETKSVAHTQYIANSELGRSLCALDLIIDHLIRDVYKDKGFFDFGISTENNGSYLNLGLIAQKEGFGANAVVHDFYELNI